MNSPLELRDVRLRGPLVPHWRWCTPPAPVQLKPRAVCGAFRVSSGGFSRSGAARVRSADGLQARASRFLGRAPGFPIGRDNECAPSEDSNSGIGAGLLPRNVPAWHVNGGSENAGDPIFRADPALPRFSGLRPPVCIPQPAALRRLIPYSRCLRPRRPASPRKERKQWKSQCRGSQRPGAAGAEASVSAGESSGFGFPATAYPIWHSK